MMITVKNALFRFLGIVTIVIALYQLPVKAQTGKGIEINKAMQKAMSTIDSVLKSTERTEHIDLLDIEPKKSHPKNSPVLVSRFHAKITLYPAEGYFDVEEHYNVQFNVKKHGIYRNIPLVYHLDTNPLGGHPDSTGFWAQRPKKHRIRITDVSVPGHTMTISGGRLSNMLNIRIGDADKYVKGPQQYTIKYQVRDAFLFDETTSFFYWNLMGNQWDFPFLESSFEVHLPGNPETEYFVYTGFRGNITSQAEYDYQEGVFSGKTNEILGLGKDMTLLLHLPADYIVRPGAMQLWWRDYGWVVFPPIALLMFFLSWFVWGRDKKPVKMVEYFPPKGINPTLAGYLTDEDTDTRDLIALIPYWGAQGILTMKIKNGKKKRFFNLKSMHLPLIILGTIYLFGLGFELSVMAISGMDGNEGVFGTFASIIPFVIIAIILLFKNMRTANHEDFILYKKKDLPLNAANYERIMFNGLFSGKQTVCSSKQLKNSFYTTLSKAKSELLSHSVGMYFTKHSSRNIIITVVLCALAGIIGGVLILLYMSILGGVLFFFTCIGLCFCSGLMRKRLVKGDEILQKVEGFRMFIKKAKRRELEWLLKENPTYFEDTLGYAVAFGFVKKYSKKFEGLITVPPQWYDAAGTHFTMNTFSNSFHSAMRATATTLVSRPSSSASGGSSISGGGSSGGGFGGGGGGSW